MLSDAEALVVSSAVIGITLQWRANRYKDVPEDIADRVVRVLADGVRLSRIHLTTKQ
jgi:hypothetical protein